jgi:replicative DNA helicase
LAHDVAYIARSLGGFCSIATKKTHYTYEGQRKQGRLSYVLNMSFSDGQQVFTLEEKKHRLRTNWQRTRRLTFQSIEPVRMAQAQCISVSHPMRTYITNNFVLTHNTSFSMNIAENVAIEVGKSVAVFSMEMGATQLGLRMVGSVGKIDQQRLRRGQLNEYDWPRLTNAIHKMQNAKIFIDETPSLSVVDLRARCRRMTRECGQLGLVVIDYLQLMSSTGKAENRTAELSVITRGLKSLAKELNCPIIALSQLNRALEQRADKRPIMSDLRESGAIEQDADLILFIYRDEVYNKDSMDRGFAEIIISKQRNGPIGTVRLSFEGSFTKFDNFSCSD